MILSFRNQQTCAIVLLLIVLWLLSPNPVNGQVTEGLQNPHGGSLLSISVSAPSLHSNIFNIPEEQPVSIYLPPSYDSTSQRYPVVYFLPGFADLVHYYTIWGVYGFSLKSSMDQLIQRGKVQEMIVVIPNGSNFLQGSFYVNSPLIGNWENYIVDDVVKYVDSHFRTIAAPASRGISGHSMGGYGALNLAMRYPDVFGAVYALSPGLAVPDGLKEHDIFADQSVVKRTLSLMDTLAKLADCQAKVRLMSCVNGMINSADNLSVFTLAYGMAFAPRSDGKPPYFDYPCRVEKGKTVFQPDIWTRWEAGFGQLEEKVKTYLTNLRKLHSIVIDVGTHDEHIWIPPGCKMMDSLLTKNGVPHQFVEFEGAHQDQLKQRLEDNMLPAMSRTLQRN
jgi:S-formylglutathione hydrolase